MEKQLSGKTVIVTGANCGIGYETALELVKRDAHAILSCRSEQRGKEAVDKIKAETKSEKVELELLDLASLKSVRAFADRIKAKCKRLDILINNAGLAGLPFSKTEDGFETTFGVNHLGHFLLTNLLLDLLKASAPSRIVNVSSEAHRGYKMNWDDLNLEKSYNGFTAYKQSKLANCLFTIELDKRLKDTGVIAVSLHPGVVETEIWRDRENMTIGSKLMMFTARPLVKLFGKSTKSGAETTIHCACSEEVTKQSGFYFDNSKPREASPEARDMVSAEKLWDISEKLVGLK